MTQTKTTTTTLLRSVRWILMGHNYTILTTAIIGTITSRWLVCDLIVIILLYSLDSLSRCEFLIHCVRRLSHQSLIQNLAFLFLLSWIFKWMFWFLFSIIFFNVNIKQRSLLFCKSIRGASVSHSVSQKILIILCQTIWSPIVLCGPLWISMDPYGLVWSNMVLYGPVWSILIPYGPLGSSMVLCGPIWSSIFP